MPPEIADSVVLVSGAASGIGRATALLAARLGARGLVLNDVDADRAHVTADRVRVFGVDAVVCPGSVADAEVSGALVAAAVDRFGRLDVAINNAGVRGDLAGIDECSEDNFDRVVTVNLRSVFLALRAQLRLMYAQGSGSIVNVASAGVFHAEATLAPYLASKHGVIALSKVASKEATAHGVRVNVVCPGPTDTPMQSGHLDETRSSYATSADLLHRMGTPDEIAEVIAFLASRSASFVNGAVVVADGGRTG